MSTPVTTIEGVKAALDRIRSAWRTGRCRDMAALLAPEAVFVFPGFEGRLVGREQMLESYEQFVAEASVRSYEETALTIDGGAEAAVAQVTFEMVYVRDGQAWRSRGQELWALERRPDGWVAFWRTMQGLSEEAVQD